MDHYLVKLTVNGVTQYGIANTHAHKSDGTRVAAKPGKVFVVDAIFGFFKQVDESLLVDIDLTKDNEYDRFVEAELKKAEAKSAECGGQLKPGAMFCSPRGDGCAFYVVTAVGARTCKIEWRGFSVDHWVDPMFGYGGSFRNSDVRRYLHT
jgi:hypothetical protein